MAEVKYFEKCSFISRSLSYKRKGYNLESIFFYGREGSGHNKLSGLFILVWSYFELSDHQLTQDL